MLGQPGQEPLAGSRPQVQHDGADVGGAGLGDLPHGGLQLGGGVGQERHDRAHQHAAAQPVLAERAAHAEPAPRAGRARLQGPPQFLVRAADRHAQPHVGDLRGGEQQVEVAEDQRALGQDGVRVAGVQQGLEDPRHQLVLALGPLVDVHVGAHGDVLALPLARAELLADQGRGVDLDHDLGVEVMPGVQVQVGMRVAGEAVNTRMATSTIGINSPAERDAGGVGHPVDHAAGVHLEERHAAEARGVERPGDGAALEQRGRGRARAAARAPAPPAGRGHRPSRGRPGSRGRPCLPAESAARSIA